MLQYLLVLSSKHKLHFQHDSNLVSLPVFAQNLGYVKYSV